MKTLSKFLLVALISASEKRRHKPESKVVDPGVFVDLVAVVAPPYGQGGPRITLT